MFYHQEQDAVNHFLSRAHKFTVNEEGDEAKASLVLPDINVLSRSFSTGKLALLLMSCGIILYHLIFIWLFFYFCSGHSSFVVTSLFSLSHA